MKAMARRVFGMFLAFAAMLFSSGCVHWHTLAEAQLDGQPAQNTSLITTDPGLKWSAQKGVGRFAGRSSDTQWIGNHVVLAVTNDNRTILELSGDFKIAKSTDYQLVALWGIIDDGRKTDGPLCLYFEGDKGKGQYIIQTRWITNRTTMVGKEAGLVGFGDETQEFHTMRIVLDRVNSLITYYADEEKIGAVKFEGVITPITKVQMDVETPAAGTDLDILFKNIKARSSGPLYSARTPLPKK